MCLENEEWSGEETICERKDCGSPNKVNKDSGRGRGGDCGSPNEVNRN